MSAVETPNLRLNKTCLSHYKPPLIKPLSDNYENVQTVVTFTCDTSNRKITLLQVRNIHPEKYRKNQQIK